MFHFETNCKTLLGAASSHESHGWSASNLFDLKWALKLGKRKNRKSVRNVTKLGTIILNPSGFSIAHKPLDPNTILQVMFRHVSDILSCCQHGVLLISRPWYLQKRLVGAAKSNSPSVRICFSDFLLCFKHFPHAQYLRCGRWAETEVLRYFELVLVELPSDKDTRSWRCHRGWNSQRYPRGCTSIYSSSMRCSAKCSFFCWFPHPRGLFRNMKKLILNTASCRMRTTPTSLERLRQSYDRKTTYHPGTFLGNPKKEL